MPEIHKYTFYMSMPRLVVRQQVKISQAIESTTTPVQKATQRPRLKFNKQYQDEVFRIFGKF